MTSCAGGTIIFTDVALFTAMGTGSSKKEAKHAAAKSVLDQLIVSSQGDGSLGTNSVTV
jgi:hypothetical protein